MGKKREKREKKSVIAILKILKELAPLIGSALFTLCLYRGSFESIWDDYVAKPYFVYSQEDGKERYESSIELGDGVLTLYPQITIRNKTRGIYRVGIKELYQENGLSCTSAIVESEEQKTTFWEFDPVITREKIQELGGQIEIQLLDEKITAEDIIITQTTLMQLNYKNKKLGQNRTAYYILERGSVTSIDKEEIKDHRSDFEVSVEALEESIDMIVLNCRHTFSR